MRKALLFKVVGPPRETELETRRRRTLHARGPVGSSTDGVDAGILTHGE
jgi:hypothetical protein